MRTVIILSAILFVTTLILFLLSSFLRSELPNQQPIILDSSLAFFNEGNYHTHDLVLTCNSGASITVHAYNPDGFVKIEHLVNGKVYEVTISRTDIWGKLKYKPITFNLSPLRSGTKYIVLIGASVGKSWHVPEISQRLHHQIQTPYSFGFRCIYNFNKKPALLSLINFPVKPYAVIIKECAAYFPRDIGLSKESVMNWVNLLRKNNIIPILATACPVTKEHDKEHPGRQQSILEYNNFIRYFTLSNNLPMLDIEKALRINDANRYLNLRFASADGLHLNTTGYREVLDPLIVAALPSWQQPAP